MKEYPFDYNGSAKLEVDDNPKAGIIMKILKMALKHRQGSPLPEPDFDEYVVGLAVNLTDQFRAKPEDVRNLPWDKYAQLCEILGEQFPMEKFFIPLGKLIFGAKLNVPDSISAITSTSNSQNSALPNAT